MQLLHNVFFTFPMILKENISDNQELFEFGIISSILMNLIFDSGATMLEEVLTSSGM